MRSIRRAFTGASFVLSLGLGGLVVLTTPGDQFAEGKLNAGTTTSTEATTSATTYYWMDSKLNCPKECNNEKYDCPCRETFEP